MRLLAALLLLAGSAFGQCSYSAVFPSNVATDGTLFVARDGVTTSLALPMTAGDVTAFVKSSSGWVVNMIATIDSEKMQVTGVAANALTVTRGLGQSIPAAHSSGKAVSAFIDCDHHQTVTAELKAIETALGPNLSNISAGPVTNSSTYNFTPQTPGGSLIIGNNTISMAPCPLGVAGTHTVAANVPHLLYISGGTGTAEAAPISGGTCTSGATTGTVILTAAHTHSGAWTIKSNTTGAQEAIYAAGPSGAVRMPGATIDLWGNTASIAALTIPDGYSTSFRGSGVGATTILTHGTTNNWITWDYVSQGGLIDAGDFYMLDAANTPHTTGRFLWVRYRTAGDFSRVYLNDCYDCLVVERNAAANYHDMLIGTWHYGLQITCNGAHLATCQNTGNYYAMQFSGAAAGGDTVRVESPTAGITFSSISVGSVSNSGNNGIHIIALDAGDPLNELSFSNCIVDGHQVGVRITGNGSTFNSNQISFTGGRWNSAQYAGFFESYASNVSLNGVTMVSAGAGGVGFDRAVALSGNTQHISIKNSPLIATDGDACALETGASADFVFQNNRCGDSVGGVQPTHGIDVTGTITGLTLNDNDFSQVLTGAINNAGIINGTVKFSNNIGIDTVIPAVASAATLAFPFNPVFTITGTTGPTAVTFPLATGASGRFTATDGTVTFTAGASIGNSWVALQNVPTAWHWDGTKIWLGGGGPLTQFGTCTLGTNCAVTFPVTFAASTYQCSATDQTAAAAVKVVNTSASVATFTGTGTDVISYVCTGR